MIQINLLPVQEAEKRRSGKQVYILGSLLMVLQVIVLFTLQGEKENELSELRTRNAVLKREIEQLRARTNRVNELEQVRVELERQKNVLDNLLASQSGPVLLLASVAEMLTASDSAVDRANMRARNWTPTWNPDELWLDAFEDKQRKIKIEGHALDQKRCPSLAAVKGREMMRFVFEAVALYGELDVDRYLACTLGPDDINSKKQKK